MDNSWTDRQMEGRPENTLPPPPVGDVGIKKSSNNDFEQFGLKS